MLRGGDIKINVYICNSPAQGGITGKVVRLEKRLSIQLTVAVLRQYSAKDNWLYNLLSYINHFIWHIYIYMNTMYTLHAF